MHRSQQELNNQAGILVSVFKHYYRCPHSVNSSLRIRRTDQALAYQGAGGTVPFLDTLPPLFWNLGKEISPCTKRRPHGGECKGGNQIRKSFPSGQGQVPLGLSLGVSRGRRPMRGCGPGTRWALAGSQMPARMNEPAALPPPLGRGRRSRPSSMASSL